MGSNFADLHTSRLAAFHNLIACSMAEGAVLLETMSPYFSLFAASRASDWGIKPVFSNLKAKNKSHPLNEKPFAKLQGCFRSTIGSGGLRGGVPVWIGTPSLQQCGADELEKGVAIEVRVVDVCFRWDDALGIKVKRTWCRNKWRYIISQHNASRSEVGGLIESTSALLGSKVMEKTKTRANPCICVRCFVGVDSLLLLTNSR